MGEEKEVTERMIRSGEQVGKKMGEKERLQVSYESEFASLIRTQIEKNNVDVANQVAQYQNQLERNFIVPTPPPITYKEQQKRREDEMEEKSGNVSYGTGYNVSEYVTTDYETTDYNIGEYKSVYD